MGSIIIQGRVQQKTDTEANWIANELPILPGECAYVSDATGSIPTNFKINTLAEPALFVDLPYYFDASMRVPIFGSAAPDDEPDPPTGDGFWIALEAGTYTNFGGVELPPASLGVISRVGAYFSIAIIELSITTVPNGITNAGYGNIDKLWGAYSSVAAANAAIPNTTVSGKSYREGKFVGIGTSPNIKIYWWKGGYSDSNLVEFLPVFTVEKSPEQIFDINNYLHDTSLLSDNTTQASVGSATTPYYPVKSGETVLSWSGLGNAAGKRIAWVNDSDTLIRMDSITAGSGTNSIPSGATKFRYRFKIPADPDTVPDTFMLNWGAPQPYESYEYITLIDKRPISDKKINSVTEMHAVLSGTSPTVNASNWYRACPVVADVAMKGNTGLGYDLKRNLYLVSEYNTTISSRLLIFRESDLVTRNTTAPVISTPYKVIDVTEYIDHIQACTWDFVDDTYLVLGTIKGAETSSNNSLVLRLSSFGTLIDYIPLGDNLIVQVGMIDVMIDGNYIIKPNSGSTAYIYNRSFSLINRVGLITNEGLAVNKYNGDIWCANDAFTVNKYDKNFNLLSTYSFNTFTNESGGSNVEGMCIKPNGGLVISADAYLHGGTQLGNSLFFFDFDLTVNKRHNFYLPNGFGDPHNIGIEYVSEIISPGQTITSVVVESNFTAKKTYRAGNSKSTAAVAVFSPTLTSNTFFQTKISL